MVETLLAVDLVILLEALEKRIGVELPWKVVEVSLTGGVLYVRFEYPETAESDVEPLPTATPAYLFRDEKTGRITALEVLDVDELLAELEKGSASVQRS